MPKSTTSKELQKNQWDKGVSGNPKGRPKGSKNKTTLIKQAIEGDIVAEVGDRVQNVAMKAFELAEQGDPIMISLIWNTFMTKAIKEEKSDNKGTGGINITITGMAEKPAINAEIIEEVKDEDE